MSDAPKTLALNSAEWKALLVSNIDQLRQFVMEAGGLTPQGVVVVGDHLERMKGIAAAWQASQPPAPVGENAQPAPAQSAANGAAAPVVKKGGWPKGRKRGAPQQVAQ